MFEYCTTIRKYFKYIIQVLWLISSVADPDPVPFWPLDPGSGIGFFPDLESRIPNPYFWELIDNFWGKKFYNSLKIGPNFFLQHFKTKIICNSVKMWLHKKLWQQFLFHPSLLLLFLDPGSEIQYPGSEIRDPRSGIRDPGSEIRDPRSGIRDPVWVKIRIRDPGWVKIRTRDPG